MDNEFLGVVKQNANNKITYLFVLGKITDHSSFPSFLRGYGHWSKWREGGWSYPVARANPEKGAMAWGWRINKFPLDMSNFF